MLLEQPHARNLAAPHDDRPAASMEAAHCVCSKVQRFNRSRRETQICHEAPQLLSRYNTGNVRITPIATKERTSWDVSNVPVSDSCTAANSNAIRSSRQRAAEVAGAREAERLGGLEWDSLVGKAARSRESVMLTVSILRRRQCAAAVDTPSDGGPCWLARSAFEAVSATNLVPIKSTTVPSPQHPLDGSIGLRMGTRSL